MTPVDPELADVAGLERRLLQPAVRGDAAAVAALLHPDYLEFGRSGRVWTHDAMVAALAADPAVSGPVGELEARRLADDVVLVTYRIGGGRPSLRSSVWVRTATGWQVRFHQGTAT